MYDISIPVTAKVIEPHKRIVIEWPGYSGLTTVEWIFESLADGTTFVRISDTSFSGDGDELVKTGNRLNSGIFFGTRRVESAP